MRCAWFSRHPRFHGARSPLALQADLSSAETVGWMVPTQGSQSTPIHVSPGVSGTGTKAVIWLIAGGRRPEAIAAEFSFVRYRSGYPCVAL